MRKANQHILVIRFSSLGDVAITVPVLIALHESYPNCKITVLTKPIFTPLFSHLKWITVIPVNLKKEFNGIIGLWRLAKFIKSLGVDAIADCHNVLRTKILKIFLLNLKWAILDKGRSEKKQLTSGKIFKPLKPTIERYADVFRALGHQISLENLELITPKMQSKKVNHFLKNKTKPLIGIAPFAAYSSKVYPMEKMERVIEELSNHASILLFGGGSKEQQQMDMIAQDKVNVWSVVGQFSLEEELILISHLQVMLAMDSGNAHLAAMTGIKVITLWGVTHPYSGFIPFNQPLENCLLSDREKYPKIPTSVYGNRYPKGYENAIASIDEKEIVKAVRLA